MSSTNKTSLGLNMWEASDKPVRQDFVNDNVIIDEKITQLNSNLAMRGKFAIRDTNLTLDKTAPTIPMTRTIENPNNFYSINADGTITVPAGIYLITAMIHGIQSANEFLYLSITCGGNTVTNNYCWNVTEQYYRELSLNVKITSTSVLRVFGSSTGGNCTVFGYLAAIDTTLTIQKIA